MFNGNFALVWKQYGNNIKTGRLVQEFVTIQVVEGNSCQLGLFLCGHCLERLAKTEGFSGLNLDKDQTIPITSYDINFSNFLPIISCQDGKTQFYEVVGCKIFPLFPESDSCLRQTL